MNPHHDDLGALAELAEQLGADDVVAEARVASRRLEEGLFFVACLGQFKRGKSTLLNALIGAPILPTGVLPVTAMITLIRFGATTLTVVRFVDGERCEIDVADLLEFVTEDRNPRNTKGVAVVELYVNAPLLASGMCLVDTPGLGSVFEQSTAATRRFLPHVDAALLVIGADPPISAEEAALAVEIGREVNHIIVALNKADRLADDDVRQAVSFTRRVFCETTKADPEVFVVSAVERLRGAITRDWLELENSLVSLARDAGTELVRAAGVRAMRRLTQRLQREVVDRRSALLQPVHETEEHLKHIQATFADAQRALGDLSHVLNAEQERLSRRLAQERELFLERVIPVAHNELSAKGPNLRGDAFEAARRIAHHQIKEWLSEIEPKAEQMYVVATERFAELVNGFAQRVGDEGFEIELRFRVRRRFYFTEMLELTARSARSIVWGPFRESRRYLRRLLETNSARVINDLLDRVLESRRQVESEVALYLRGVVTITERAADEGHRAHAAGTAAVASELARLDSIATELNRFNLST